MLVSDFAFRISNLTTYWIKILEEYIIENRYGIREWDYNQPAFWEGAFLYRLDGREWKNNREGKEA